MIMDKFTTFGDNEDAFADGAATVVGDSVDTKDARPIGHGTPMYLILQVSTDFVGGTSAEFKLVSDAVDPVLAASATEHLTTGAVPVADLVVGWRKVLTLPPDMTYERYLGIVSDCTGNVTAGAIDAWITQDRPGWYTLPEGNN
jgi:hypothetical protein